MLTVKSIDARNKEEIVQWDMKSFSVLKNQAESGDVQSQATMGYLYLTGTFVEENFSKSEYWLLKAANSNHVEAQKNLAILYQERGEVDKSIYWNRLAAAAGSYDAQLNLALILGDQPNFDSHEIISLLEQSIKNNPDINPDAYYSLGWWYLHDEKVLNVTRGIAMLDVAIQKNDGVAAYVKAEILAEGKLLPQDKEESMKLYQRAAQLGVPEAIEKLKSEHLK